MAVNYRYRSSVETFSLPVPAASVSVGELKRLILGTSRHGLGRKHGRGPREGIALSDAQTGEEYADDAESVPCNSTVVVRRVPGLPVETIVVESSSSTVLKSTQDSYSAATSSASAGDKDEEAKAVSAVIDAAELKWKDLSQRPRCYDHHGAAYSQRAPPAGYVCRRCRIPGHFIQHCPTNGDPKFDLRRAMANPTALAPAPVAPVTFIPDDSIPEDLRCKLCKKVMSDAVLASKCCFTSFCDTCIRAHIAANSKCACGARARAGDLIPNPTLRAMIASTLDTRSSSASSGTENPKSSVSSNAVPTSQSPAAAPQQSSVSSAKCAASTVSELHGDGSGSTTLKITRCLPTTEHESTAEEAKTRRISHADQYAHSVPSGPPACYNPYFGWMDPRMYYGGGGMPYAYGGGYPMAAAPPPHHVGAMGNVPVSHGRKRTTECEDQMHPDHGFKRRCTGSRSHMSR